MSYRHLTTIRETMRLFLQENQMELNTAIPGFVESFDGAAKTADISIPITGYVRGDNKQGLENPWPVLPAVPVWYPGGGNWEKTWALKNGDPVLLIFCQRNIANWFLSDGREPVAEDIPEMHGESSAICLPRLFPRGKSGEPVHGDDYTIRGQGGNFVVESDRSEFGKRGAGEAVALASKQDPFNMQAGAQIDLIYNIFLPGVVPALSPVDPVGSRRLFTDG